MFFYYLMFYQKMIRDTTNCCIPTHVWERKRVSVYISVFSYSFLKHMMFFFKLTFKLSCCEIFYRLWSYRRSRIYSISINFSVSQLPTLSGMSCQQASSPKRRVNLVILIENQIIIVVVLLWNKSTTIKSTFIICILIPVCSCMCYYLNIICTFLFRKTHYKTFRFYKKNTIIRLWDLICSVQIEKKNL